MQKRNEGSKEDDKVFKEISFWLEHESVRNVINDKLYYWYQGKTEKGYNNTNVKQEE